MSAPALIALDWGTTSLRAWLFNRDGSVLDAKQSQSGILAVATGGFGTAFAEFTNPWQPDGLRLPAIACGMVGSRQGWREAPYAACPCSAEDLPSRLLHIESEQGMLAVVPGVAFDPGGRPPDVMRGEETQVFGALASSYADSVMVLPGTHSKWVSVEKGRIVGFSTWMTGEVFAVMRAHSILGRTMAEGDVTHDAVAFGDGVGAGLRGGSQLLHRLFEVRSLALFDRLPATAGASYLSGLLIGSEIAAAREEIGSDRSPVTLIGAAALVSRYAEALGVAGVDSRIADPEVTPRGLWRIAQAAGMIEP